MLRQDKSTAELEKKRGIFDLCLGLVNHNDPVGFYRTSNHAKPSPSLHAPLVE